MIKQAICFVVVLLIAGNCSAIKSSEVPAYARQRLLNCGACDFVMQELKKDLFDLGWNDSVAKLTELVSNSDFLLRYPEFGGNLERRMMQILYNVQEQYDAELHEVFDAKTALQLCSSLFYCNLDTLEELDECGDCVEGGCTTFGHCLLGIKETKRNFVLPDHPLVDKLTPDMYERLLTIEEVEALRKRKENSKPPNFPFIDHSTHYGAGQENTEDEEADQGAGDSLDQKEII